MTYVMSDIHGCFDRYAEMLEIIDFSDNDTLFVIGDVIDRGDGSVLLLQDMSMRANVIPIMGNHEYAACSVLPQMLMLMQEITEESSEELLKTGLEKGIDVMKFAEEVNAWNEIGGDATIQGFRELPADEREYLLEYLEEFSLYEIIKVNGKKYVLTHFGLPAGATAKNLDTFDAWDFVTAEMDYNKQYFNDAFLVTGHLPTFEVDESARGRIYRNCNNISIDAGAIAGEKLACLCLDTDEEFYV